MESNDRKHIHRPRPSLNPLLLLVATCLLALAGCGTSSDDASDAAGALEGQAGSREAASNTAQLGSSEGQEAVCAHEQGTHERAENLTESGDFDEMKATSVRYLQSEIALRTAIDPSSDVEEEYDLITNALDVVRIAFESSDDWSGYLETLGREAKSSLGSQASINAAVGRYRHWVAKNCNGVVLGPHDYKFSFEA